MDTNPFTQKEVEQFWDLVAPCYEEYNDKVHDTHYQRFRESIKELKLIKGSSILNIWSRTGLATKFLREQETQLTIINAELSKEMINLGKKNFPDEHFEKISLEQLPYKNNSFEEILSLETLEHISHPLTFLKELYRVLKPGGKLVMSTPPATSEISLFLYELFFENHGEGPHTFLGSRKVKQLLQNAGFELITHRGTLLVPVGPEWLKKMGEYCIDRFQNTCISELGIRQFYIVKK